MDSPLNLAHQQARKADHVMKTGKFEDAIYCHKRAAEHILDAMQLTSSTHALESLRLQHQYHLKQQDFIRGRQRRAEAAQLEGSRVKTGEVKDKCSPLINQTTDSEDYTDGRQSCATSTEDSDTHLLSDTDHSLVYRTMAETDSLLQYLASRNYGNYSLRDVEKQRESSQRPKTTEEIVAAAVKSPKDDKTIIEELRIHNEELRRHISLILKELEASNNEKALLAHKLEQYEHAQALYLDNIDNEDIKLPSLDLPPLEMPQFDFDTVKHEMASSTEGSELQLETREDI